MPVLTGRFFFGVMRVATVFVRLLRISGFLSSHVARIEMILAIRIFARLLRVRVFVVIVGHKEFLQKEEQHPTPPQPLGSYRRLGGFGEWPFSRPTLQPILMIGPIPRDYSPQSES